MSSLAAGMRKLAKLVGDLDSRLKAVPTGVTAAMSMSAMRLAEFGAGTHQTPGGRSWKPTRSGMVALRGLRFERRFTSRGFAVTGRVTAARFHQKGGKKRGTKWVLPARSFLPKRSIPNRWKPAMKEACLGEIKRVLHA